MYDEHSRFNHLRITDNNGVRLLRFERNRQSSMYLDDPYETDFEYPGYFHLALAIAPHATETLVIGLGGGSVVKRMWRDYRHMRLDVVEIDEEVVEIARAFFALPDDERIRVTVADGREYVRRCPDTYDIVIVDAYDDDRFPRPLMTEEFMRDIADRLKPCGVVVYNFIGALYGPKSKPFRSLYRTAGNVWGSVWVFPIGYGEDVTDKSRNIILLASNTAISDEDLLARIGERVGGMVTVPKFERFGEDLYRGRIRAGDVPLIVEAPTRKRLRR